MPGESGNGSGRLDRIEAALEGLVRSQSHLMEAQISLVREHKTLLTAQVLLAEAQKKTEDKLAALSDRLDALIAVVDGIVRGRQHEQ